MGGYADYALATKVPALWARMQKDQAQKRTGDLAKNMFAQLDGLDPQSKEYFQRMRQLSMESGDDTLYQTGEGLNKAQQGYVWDDPMLTGHWKDFLLEGGDPNDKNAFAAWNDRRASQSGTKVNITMPGQPGFDWSSPVPMEVLEKATPGTAEFIPGMTWSEFRSSGAKMPGKSRPEFEATADSDSNLLMNELVNLSSLVSSPGFSSNKNVAKDLGLKIFQKATQGGALEPLGDYAGTQVSVNKQLLEAANDIVEQVATKRFTGASATGNQEAAFKNAYTIRYTDDPKVIKAKMLRITQLANAAQKLGSGLKIKNIEGILTLGSRIADDGIKETYVIAPAGDIKVIRHDKGVKK